MKLIKYIVLIFYFYFFKINNKAAIEKTIWLNSIFF